VNEPQGRKGREAIAPSHIAHRSHRWTQIPSQRRAGATTKTRRHQDVECGVNEPQGRKGREAIAPSHIAHRSHRWAQIPSQRRTVATTKTRRHQDVAHEAIAPSHTARRSHRWTQIPSQRRNHEDTKTRSGRIMSKSHEYYGPRGPASTSPRSRIECQTQAETARRRCVGLLIGSAGRTLVFGVSTRSTGGGGPTDTDSAAIIDCDAS